MKIKYPVIVEGKYDKIKITSLFEATVITTDGFGIFNKKEKLSGFSAFMDGVVCEECKGRMKEVISINPSTLYTLQYIVCTPIGKLFSFTVSEEVLSELRMVMGRSMHMYIDQKMNSLDILEAFT